VFLATLTIKYVELTELTFKNMTIQVDIVHLAITYTIHVCTPVSSTVTFYALNYTGVAAEILGLSVGLTTVESIAVWSTEGVDGGISFW